MKKLLLPLLLGCFTFGHAQDSISSGAKWDRKVRLNFFYPIGFGNNAHAKAQHPVGGLAFTYDIVAVSKLHLGLGIERVVYSVDDEQLLGTYYASTNDTNAYIYFAYDFPIGVAYTLRPEIGGGYSFFNYSAVSDLGQQNGYNLRGGIRFETKLTRVIGANAGIYYVNNRFESHAVAQYEDFFAQASSVQIGAGIQIRLGIKRPKHNKTKSRK